MDDFNGIALHESKNEWGARLVTILTPLIIDGYKSILDESCKLCKDNGESNKYLMTFQNLISRIPKWNANIIETERKRICEKSGCSYLEELITCVHIIQLKILTAMRVGQKQKKIDINIPKLDEFLHKTYVNVARKLYKNVYLFEINLPPLNIQKNHREIEIIVQECILNTIREGIPVESILKAYMDESVEEDVVEEVSEQIIDEPIKQVVAGGAVANTTENTSLPNVSTQIPSRLSFNDIDYVKGLDGEVSNVEAPKNISRLEEVSNIRAQQRKADEEDDDDQDRLTISTQPFTLDALDIHNIEEPPLDLLPDLLLDEIEVLE
jgi:urease gamma subunit